VRISVAAEPAPFSVMQIAGLSPDRTGEATLRVGPVGHDRADRAHVGLDRDAARDGAGLRHLLDDQHGLQVAEAATAVLARDRHAEEASLAHPRDDVPGIGLAAVGLRRAGRDLRGQRAGALAQRLLLGREFGHAALSHACAR
jgi:hypothetical protein